MILFLQTTTSNIIADLFTIPPLLALAIARPLRTDTTRSAAGYILMRVHSGYRSCRSLHLLLPLSYLLKHSWFRRVVASHRGLAACCSGEDGLLFSSWSVGRMHEFQMKQACEPRHRDSLFTHHPSRLPRLAGCARHGVACFADLCIRIGGLAACCSEEDGLLFSSWNAGRCECATMPLCQHLTLAKFSIR